MLFLILLLHIYFWVCSLSLLHFALHIVDDDRINWTPVENKKKLNFLFIERSSPVKYIVPNKKLVHFSFLFLFPVSLTVLSVMIQCFIGCGDWVSLWLSWMRYYLMKCDWKFELSYVYKDVYILLDILPMCQNLERDRML